MADNNQTQTLAHVDIFSLIDADQIPDDDKLKMLSKMQAILLNDFFAHDLPNLLSEEEIAEFEKMYDEQANADEIILALRDKIPDIEDRMYEKSLDFKSKFITNQIDQNLNVVNKKIELIKKGEFPADKIPGGNVNQELMRLNKEKVRLRTVLHYYRQGLWNEGLMVLKGDETLETQ